MFFIHSSIKGHLVVSMSWLRWVILQWTWRWNTVLKRVSFCFFVIIWVRLIVKTDQKMLEKQGESKKLIRGSLLLHAYCSPVVRPCFLLPLRSWYNQSTKSPPTSPPAPPMWELDYLNFCSVIAKYACVNQARSSILLGTFDQKLGLGHNPY